MPCRLFTVEDRRFNRLHFFMLVYGTDAWMGGGLDSGPHIVQIDRIVWFVWNTSARWKSGFS